jgi:hypothetical protein
MPCQGAGCKTFVLMKSNPFSQKKLLELVFRGGSGDSVVVTGEGDPQQRLA